jgi:hypothetical protein
MLQYHDIEAFKQSGNVSIRAAVVNHHDVREYCAAV